MATIPEARPTSGEARERQVQTLFSEIAPRYDLLNHVLSLNIDRRWRRRAVDALDWKERGRYLDACAGTYDLSLELADRTGFHGSVVASDFARPMLVEGRPKLASRPVRPVCGDTLGLPFLDDAFEGVMVAFGVRNLSDLAAGLTELHRVLKPGGRLVILEFTRPPNATVRWGYELYFNHLLPRVGRLVSGHPWAYSYLPASVSEFPGPDALEDLMRAAGFARATHTLQSFGIAAIHVGEKV